MSWRDSLWAAAAAASTLKDHAQFNITETLQTAAAKAQQTYEATAAAAASYSNSAAHQPDSNGHHTHDPASPAFSPSPSTASFSPDVTSPASSTSSSLSSIASSLTSLPSSLSSFSLPSSFSRLTSLTDSATPHSHAPLPSVHEEREQLIPSGAARRDDVSPEPVVLNAEDDLPPLVVNKSSLHSQQPAAAPGRASQASADSEPAPSLYYTPRQHHARNARRELLSSATPPSSASAGRSSPAAASVAQFEHARQAQVQLFAAQEEVMEDMRESIARLGELGAAIGGEVREQGAMLKEMDDGMEESQGLMAVNRRKLEKILQTAPSSHLRIIAVMVLVVGVLLYCVLFV
jgi:hypothetical protein